MLRLLVGLVMISVINGQHLSLLPKIFTNKENIFDWSAGIYDRINNFENVTETTSNLKLLKTVAELSNHLQELNKHISITCNQILESLLSNITYEDFDNPGAELCRNINKVNHFFEDSEHFDLHESFSDKTLESFGHKVLWGDINLPDSLDDLHESLMSDRYSSGLLTLMYQHSMKNLQYECDTNSSTQQRIYFIYIQLIMSEMRGLLTLQRIYLIKRMVKGAEHDYVAELNYARENFQKRVNDYYVTFFRSVNTFPQLVRRCDIKEPRFGDNFLEFRKLSRFMLLDSMFKEIPECLLCQYMAGGQKILYRMDASIFNCISLGTTVESCPAEPGSHRDHLWWKDAFGVYYGHNTTCNAMKHHKGCAICGCSVDIGKTHNDDNNTIWRISITDQISDVWNNMVVTGIKFATQDNALHLQIRQSNFSLDGLVHNSGSWKELDFRYRRRCSASSKVKMSYAPLRFNRKTLYLDDIKAPEGHAVIGVRFRPAGGSAFKLQLLATPFNFQTGRLYPSANNWIDASTNPWRPKDYEHKRVEINLDNSDDPTRTTQFEYDLRSNKQIKFMHTDIHKDAGQTTVPLLDAQPVETVPPFPLSGIGLSYKGKDGFGGYIAPRIYTVSITNNMEYLDEFQGVPQLKYLHQKLGE